MELSIRGLVERIGGRPLIMGILNVTGDSFFDGGKYADRDAAVDRGLAMYEDGVDTIDIGGDAPEPGCQPRFVG